MRTILFAVGFCLHTLFAFAQLDESTELGDGPSYANELQFKIGYGTFRMDDMKELQKSFLGDSPIPYEITDEFPGYFVYELQYSGSIDDNLMLGGFGYFQSTGGRMHYGDYSGESFVNQYLREYGVGVLISSRFSIHDKFFIPVYLKTSIGLTRLRIHQSLTINGQSGSSTSEDELELFSTGFSLEPGFSMQKVLSHFLISLNCGYLLNVNGKLYLDGDKDKGFLTDDNDEPLKAQWDGVRISLGVGYTF